MKEIYKKEKFNLETLSPVHIGTGNKYTNWDYYIKNGRIHIVSLDKFIEQLTEKQQEILADYIENNSRSSIQDFVDYNTLDFNLLENSKMYDINLVDTSRFIHGIHEEIKHPKGLYIPASTIKGAIRTAVLYCLLKENKENYKFSIENKQIVLRNKEGKELAKGLNEKDKNSIQNFLEREFFGENQSNDIFKYLKISDSYVNKNFNNLECRKIYIANTTTFETVLPNGKKIRKHPEYYEIITEETEFDGIEISVIYEEQLKRFVKPKYHKTLEKIKNWKKCLYEFSKDLIEAEIKFWENEDVENMIKQAYGKSPHNYLIRLFSKTEVLSHLKGIEKQNTPEEPVIRIGKLSGYLTHSIGLLLAKDEYNVYEFAKVFDRKAKNDLYPLTRRLTLDNQTLGWCKLKISKKENISTKKTSEKHKEKIEKINEDVLRKLAGKLGGTYRG